MDLKFEKDIFEIEIEEYSKTEQFIINGSEKEHNLLGHSLSILLNNFNNVYTILSKYKQDISSATDIMSLTKVSKKAIDDLLKLNIAFIALKNDIITLFNENKDMAILKNELYTYIKDLFFYFGTTYELMNSNNYASFRNGVMFKIKSPVIIQCIFKAPYERNYQPLYKCSDFIYKYEVISFTDLLTIFTYYIFFNKLYVTRCKNCNLFFPHIDGRDFYCDRPVKNFPDLTCETYIKKNNYEFNLESDIENPKTIKSKSIQNMYKKTYVLITDRIKQNKRKKLDTTDLENIKIKFSNMYKDIITPAFNNKEENFTFIENYLKLVHKNISNRNYDISELIIENGKLKYKN